MNSAPKLVARFPSLVKIVLQVYSMDLCASFVDLFLLELAKLSYVLIYYTKDILVQNCFSPSYVIRKRRKRFPDEELNEQMVNASKFKNGVFILLSYVSASLGFSLLLFLLN